MSEVSEMNEPWSKPSTGRRGGRRSLAALLLAAGLTLSACGQLSVQVGPPAATATPTATAVTLAVPAQPTTAPTAAFATPNESAGSVLIGSLPLATATSPPAPTATSAPPPPAQPTATTAPAPTRAQTPVPAPPTNAPAPAGAIGQQPTQPTPTALPLGGAVPAGWQVYQGPARMPFTMTYPPGWTVDDSKVTEIDRRVFFRSPDDPERTYLMIGLLGLLNYSSGDGDELRNQIFRYEVDSLAGAYGLCGKKEIEVTRDNRFAGLTFKSVGATCQRASGLHYVYAGVGVGDDPKLWYAPWRFAVVAPYGDYQRDADQLYLPMLNSLTIVSQTKAK